MLLDKLKEKQRRLIKNIKSISYERTALEFIKSDEKLIALIGSRGVGKTTLLLQYASLFEFDDVLYFSADSIGVSKIGFYEIAEEFVRLGGKVIIIDEIHQFKDWAKHIKNIYDDFDLIIRISGSSMLNILMKGHDLSRRILIKELRNLSFKEFFEITENIKLKSYSLKEIINNHNEISFELTTKYSNLYKEWKRYLEIGSYPYFLTSSNKENFYSKLFNSIEKIIHEDIPSTNKIKYDSLVTFKKLMYILISSRVPFKVNMNSLSKELSISEPTLYIYLDILNKTGLFRAIKKFSNKVSRKPAKLYFDNTSILNAVSYDMSIALEVGTIRETYFVNLFKDIYYSDIGDFRVKDYIFEVGGINKNFHQIKDIKNSFLAIDTDTTINKRKIPLWLFGFLNLDKI